MNNLQKTILEWLSRRLSSEQFEKTDSTFNSLKKGAEDWEVFSSFSAVPRFTGKEALELSRNELEEADSLRRGWNPKHWTADQLARTLMLLAMAERGRSEFLDKLDKIAVSSDMGEAVALYQSLAVLPWPEDLQERAAEGIRSNITSVFNAVSLRNPYPADYLSEDAWNQMVLKALFVGSPLYLIVGIDRRANPVLARMLVEYAHERWSAGRIVSPELWRPVGPFIDVESIDDIEKLFDQTDEIHGLAAVLALSSSDSAEAKKLLNKHSSLMNHASENHTTWKDVGKQFNEAAD